MHRRRWKLRVHSQRHSPVDLRLCSFRFSFLRVSYLLEDLQRMNETFPVKRPSPSGRCCKEPDAITPQRPIANPKSSEKLLQDSTGTGEAVNRYGKRVGS